MPGGDRTGPLGMGPGTGRGAGFCGGYNMPGYMNPIPGRGFGLGRPGRGFSGGGRGWRHWYYATGLPYWQRTQATPAQFQLSREQELDNLKNEAEYLQEILHNINSRIGELENKGEK